MSYDPWKKLGLKANSSGRKIKSSLLRSLDPAFNNRRISGVKSTISKAKTAQPQHRVHEYKDVKGPIKSGHNFNGKGLTQELKSQIEDAIRKNSELRSSISARKSWVHEFSSGMGLPASEIRKVSDYLLVRVTQLNRQK